MSEESKGLRLFKYFGPSQTTGTHFDLPRGATLLITIGAHAKLWNKIQALLRMRRFLDVAEQKKQSVIWLVFEKLRPQIQGPSVQGLCHRTLENQASQIEQILPAKAYLGIEHIAKKQLDDEMKRLPPDQQIAFFYKHESAFSDTVTRSQYSGASTHRETKKILKQYNKEFSERAGLNPLDIDGLVKQIEPLMPQMPTKVTATLSQTTLQEVLEEEQLEMDKTNVLNEGVQQAEQEQQQQTEQRQDTATLEEGARSPPTRFDYPTVRFALDSKESFFTEHSRCTPANRLHPSNIFSPQIYYFANLLMTKQNNDGWIKPIDYVLLVTEGDKKGYFLLSVEDAADYKQQLLAS